MAVTSNGGTGARFAKDGLSATAYPSGVRGTPVEIAETQTPLIFWRKELRPDSGGAGRTRGGLGQIIEIGSGVDCAVRHPGGVRPHRSSAARPRRRLRRRGRLCRAEVGTEAARQGLSDRPAGRAAGGADAGRRRDRRSEASARRQACRTTSKAAWCRARMRLRFTVWRADASARVVASISARRRMTDDYAADLHGRSGDDARRRPFLDARQAATASWDLSTVWPDGNFHTA